VGELKSIHEALAEYQILGTSGWTLRDAISELHEWADVFRAHFKLEVPAVPLRLARLRRNCLGHYNPGFNDFGLTDEIAIDVDHLARGIVADRWYDILGTPLHEQLHFHQQWHGKPAKPGPGNYHNAEYRAKAHACGLLVSSRGVSEGYLPDGPFLTLLRDRGVSVPDLPFASPSRKPGRSTLKKWSCGCTNVRVAVSEFAAVCLRCDNRFVCLDRH
jgi:hypothetical protein